jgi:hypothetical protein
MPSDIQSRLLSWIVMSWYSMLFFLANVIQDAW